MYVYIYIYIYIFDLSSHRPPNLVSGPSLSFSIDLSLHASEANSQQHI